jgi:hypothetical protein
MGVKKAITTHRLAAIVLASLLTAVLSGMNGSAQPPGLIPASGCPTGAVLSTDQFTTTGIPSSLTASPNSTATAGAWVLANGYVPTTSVVGTPNCNAGSSNPLNVMGFLITTTITNARDADIQEVTVYQDTNFNGRFDPGIDLAMGTKSGSDLDAGRALWYNGGASPIFVLWATPGTLCRGLGVIGANACAVALLAVVKIGPNPISGSDFALQLEAYAGDIPGAFVGGPAQGAPVSNSFGASANPQGSNITLHIIGGGSPGGPGGGTPPGGGGNFSLSLHAGWNMISSPVGSVPLSSLQGNCSFSGGPWWWDGAQYQNSSMIESAKGYWVKANSPCTMQASGSPTPEGLSLHDGWNMISSGGSWNQMNTGGCTLLSGPFWYDGTQYQSVAGGTAMNGFLGYWVKVGGSCSVTSQSLHGSKGEASFAPTMNNNTLMPPGPPVEAQMSLSLQTVRVTSAQSGRLELQLQGTGIARSELRLYNLSGQLVAAVQGTGNRLSVAALSRDGQPLANGVYLYIVTVRSADGQIITSEVKKLVVKR